MAKIDRLGWADGMSFSVYGVRVGVRVNEPVILRDVISRLPPGSKPASFQVVDHLYSIIFGEAKTDSRVRRLSLAYWNLLRIGRSRKFADVLDTFESHLQLTVAEHARSRVFVHAGVVGWKDRAIFRQGGGPQNPVELGVVLAIVERQPVAVLLRQVERDLAARHEGGRPLEQSGGRPCFRHRHGNWR